MNTEEKEFNLFSLVKLILQNFYIIIFPSLIIALLFLINLYLQNQEISKTGTALKKYYLLDNTNFQLNSINNTLNKTNSNVYLDTLLESLDTTYIDLDKTRSSETNLFYQMLYENSTSKKSIKIDDTKYFTKNFFNKLLNEFKNDFYKEYKLDFEFIEKPKFENEFEIRLIVNREATNKELENLFYNIEQDLNNYLKGKILRLVDSSILRFRTNTENLIEAILQINILLEDSYKTEISYKIDFLEEQKELAKLIGLKDYSLQIENRNDEFISNEEYLKGYEFIQRKINILNRRYDDYSKIPQVIYNKTLINLLRSDFFEKQITNEIDSIEITDKKFSLLNQYENYTIKSFDNLSTLVMFVYSLILFFAISILITIFVIFYYLYKNRI